MLTVLFDCAWRAARASKAGSFQLIAESPKLGPAVRLQLAFAATLMRPGGTHSGFLRAPAVADAA
jgi:hypothetical protein